MKELVSKQDLIHDLCTLDISLDDMEKVERYILNYEPIKSNMISEEDRECCELNDIEWLEEEIGKLEDEIQWYKIDNMNLKWEKICN